jgi:hypothetical protein
LCQRVVEGFYTPAKVSLAILALCSGVGVIYVLILFQTQQYPLALDNMLLAEFPKPDYKK